MASEKVSMVPARQVHTGLSPQAQLVFPEAFAGGTQPTHRRTAAVADPSPKSATRQLTSGFLDHRRFFELQPPPEPVPFRHQWNSRSSGGADASEDDSEDDEDDELEEEEEGDEEDENNVEDMSRKNEGENQRYSGNCRTQKMKHISAFGIRAGNVGQSGNESNNENNGSGEVRNARGGEMYYSQYLNGATGPSSSSGQKDFAVVEDGCGFSGRKEGYCLSESGESLRAILSDPLTGTLMDDAMILPCGHSFGGDGIQQIVRMKACYTCSRPLSKESIAPNLTLRVAVQAFRREEELQVNRTSKKRREKYERDKGTYGEATFTDYPRARGVQFPFAVTDRVIIKGNKRTPQRFVGREAIVTTQCLNGWYVVKTLDNAESVKLQYRSLEKVADNPSSQQSPIKMVPNWL